MWVTALLLVDRQREYVVLKEELIGVYSRGIQ